MTTLRQLVLVAPLLVLLCACGPRPCEEGAPSFEMQVATRGLVAPVASLELVAALAGQRFRRVIDLSGELEDGETSLRITELPTSSPPPAVDMTVRAYSEPGAAGELLAENTQRFDASPDACNRFRLDLARQRIGCGESCSIDCSNSTSCAIDCPTGSSCNVDCAGGEQCDVNCFAGSLCSIDCRGSGDCGEVACNGDAACALRCSDGAPCAFRHCSGTELSCPGGLVVCNGFCP